VSPVPVVCFPPAGAGASFYHPWRDFSAVLQILPVDIPGRERLFAEPPHQDLPSLVRALVDSVRHQLGDTGRVAFFGHSFGAVLAYEAARELHRMAPERELELVVSGSAGPGTPRGTPLAGLPDAELLAGVRRMTGWSDPSFDEPELQELLLPALRADVTMHEAYRPVPSPPLPMSVTVMRGLGDPLVTARGASEWAHVTSRPLRTLELRGGHMYLTENWRAALDLLEGVLLGPRVLS
jgi:surfactin synthase thioesterase subunit